jgi:hypothetical protein
VALGFDDGDPVAEYQLSRFTQGLGELSWTQGHNSRMDVRWARSGVDRTSMVAKELVTFQRKIEGLGPWARIARGG